MNFFFVTFVHLTICLIIIQYPSKHDHIYTWFQNTANQKLTENMLGLIFFRFHIAFWLSYCLLRTVLYRRCIKFLTFLMVLFIELDEVTNGLGPEPNIRNRFKEITMELWDILEFPCSDGWLAISMIKPITWVGICKQATHNYL